MENVELRRRLNGEKAGLCNLADLLFSVISAGKYFIHIMKFVQKKFNLYVLLLNYISTHNFG